MRIFYLDTTSSFLYFGLVEDDKLIFEVKKSLGKDMSKYTLSTIEEKFNEFKISTDSVDKIILVNGPGSFTGIRIGATIAKTFAWAKNIPISTITSLESMALSSKSNSDLLVPIIDARRGFVFSQIFDNKFSEISKPRYINLNILRDEANAHNVSISYISNDSFEFEVERYEPNILKIVKYFRDKEIVSPHSIDAFYLKLTEAEEKANAS